MSSRNTLLRSFHDIGLAAWFGGSLMGAIGLNGAASEAREPSERLRLSSLGWAKWAPAQIGALVLHGVGAIGLVGANKSRLAVQSEARSNSVAKTVVTVAAGASTLYSGILGTRIANHADEGAEGVTTPGDGSSPELASVQRQQRVMQWVTPALTLAIIVLTAQQGEQQRPFAGLLNRFGR